jgi:hypothetical protein
MANADRSADAKTNPEAAAPQPAGETCDANQTRRVRRGRAAGRPGPAT